MNILPGLTHRSNDFQVKRGAKIQLSVQDLKLFDVSNEVSHSPLIWEARNSGREAISRVKLRLNSRLRNLKAKKLIFAAISLFFIIQTWKLVKILYSCIDWTLRCQFKKKICRPPLFLRRRFLTFSEPKVIFFNNNKKILKLLSIVLGMLMKSWEYLSICSSTVETAAQFVYRVLKLVFLPKRMFGWLWQLGRPEKSN